VAFSHANSSIFGQWMNASKHFFFLVDNSAFNGRIKSVIGCNRGYVPFKYLNVPIFVGVSKSRL